MGEVVAVQRTPASLLEQKGRNAVLLTRRNVLGYTAILKRMCKCKDEEVGCCALRLGVNIFASASVTTRATK